MCERERERERKTEKEREREREREGENENYLVFKDIPPFKNNNYCYYLIA